MKIELTSDELQVIMAPTQRAQAEVLRLTEEVARLNSQLALAQTQSNDNIGPNGIMTKVLTEVCAHMASNQKINAIKVVRQATGLGLKDAKDIVEGNFNPTGAVRIY